MALVGVAALLLRRPLTLPMVAMAAMAVLVLLRVRWVIPVLQVRTSLLVLRLVPQALGVWAALAVRVVTVALVVSAVKLFATVMAIAHQALMAETVVTALLAVLAALAVWVGR